MLEVLIRCRDMQIVTTLYPLTKIKKVYGYDQNVKTWSVSWHCVDEQNINALHVSSTALRPTP